MEQEKKGRGRPKKVAVENETKEKRPRGRPRKEVQEPKVVRPRGRPRTRPVESENVEKRPRGRPRKDGTPINSERLEVTEKRPRGRPRKDGTPINSARETTFESSPKPRGRPRKIQLIENANDNKEISAITKADFGNTSEQNVQAGYIPVESNDFEQNFDERAPVEEKENTDIYDDGNEDLRKGDSYRKLQVATKGIIDARDEKSQEKFVRGTNTAGLINVRDAKKLQPAKHMSENLLETPKQEAPAIVANSPLVKMNISRPKTPAKPASIRAPRKATKAAPMPNKVIVITGATSGMGLAMAKTLAGLGHVVIGVGRKPTLCRDAINEIKDYYPDASIHFLVADLSLMSQVNILAEEIGEKVAEINRECVDVLIHNAASDVEEYRQTYESREYMWATNYLSAVLLTRELQPLLDRSRNAKVITFTTTYAANKCKLNWKQLRDRSGKYVNKIYEQTKLADLMFALEYDHENRNQEGLHAYCVDPGNVNTSLRTKNTSGFKKMYFDMVRKQGKTIEQGIETAVYIALNDNLPEHVVFYADKKPQEPSKFALDAENRLALKRITEADLRTN